MSSIAFDRLFRVSPNPYVLLDRDFVIAAANDAYCRETGRRESELVGRNMFEAFPSAPGTQGHDLLRASLERVVKNGRPDELALVRYDIPTDGGVAERYWSATHTPLLDERGETQWILQHTVDVTEIHNLRRIAAEVGTMGGGADASRVETGVLRRAEAVQSENMALAAETAKLRQLFAQAPGFMAVVRGRDHVFELANDAYRRLVGNRDVLGLPVREALPEVIDQGFVELLDQVTRTRKPYVGRNESVTLEAGPGGPIEERVLDFVYQPIFGHDGSVSGVFVQGHDVTEQRRAVLALRETEERFRLVAESAPVMLWMGDQQGKCLYLNRAQREFWGVELDGITDFDWSATVHPDDREKLAEGFTVGMAEHLPFAVEARYLRSDGEYRLLSTDARPRFDSEGEFLGMIGVNTDITDVRREIRQRELAEQRQQLLINELNHRVKNTLAIVQSLAMQSFRNIDEPERARADFDARLHALSAAHNLLTRQNWEAASLFDTLHSAVRATAGDNAERVRLRGPDVTLAPQTAVSLAMAVHELGTNAIKYGALSNGDGRIDFSWTIEDSGDGTDLLTIVWQESGGPPVAPPKRRGFGTRLIERGLSADLRGTAEIHFAPDGLRCTLTAPLAKAAQ